MNGFVLGDVGGKCGVAGLRGQSMFGAERDILVCDYWVHFVTQRILVTAFGFSAISVGKLRRYAGTDISPYPWCSENFCVNS